MCRNNPYQLYIPISVASDFKLLASTFRPSRQWFIHRCFASACLSGQHLILYIFKLKISTNRRSISAATHQQQRRWACWWSADTKRASQHFCGASEVEWFETDWWKCACKLRRIYFIYIQISVITKKGPVSLADWVRISTTWRRNQ